MAEKEFFSFEEALRELRLKEEELRRLVSEGEIRAFREGDTMKLRRSDVETLRTELSGGEVVDLAGAGEELVFEDDTDLDAGMATEEISEVDTLLDEEVEEVEEVAELELDEELAEDGDAEPVTPVRRAAAVESDEPSEPMFVRGIAILTTCVLLLGIPVCLAATTGSPMALARGLAGLFGNKF